MSGEKSYEGKMPLDSQQTESGREAKEKETIKKVALVTTSQIDLGVKALAGDLKNHRFEVGKFGLLKEGGYTEDEIKQILKKFEEYDAVCISTSDYRFETAVKPLINEIKNKLKKPVILGGVHAMLDPEDCLNAGADAVCLGEGERWLADLLKNWANKFERDNRNFVVKKEDLKRLDELREIPFSKEELEEFTPDFSYNNFWQIKNGKLVQVTPANVAEFVHHQIGHEHAIVYASDRGCLHSCTYCYNKNLRELYSLAGKKQERKAGLYHRTKSVKKIIEELETLKRENPEVEFLNLMNDNMAARTPEELEDFAELYKKKINWPFYCMASPQMIKDEMGGGRKIEALIGAGMRELNIGIQTNEKTNREVFGRRQSDDEIIELSKTLSEYCRKDTTALQDGKIDVFYDFIIHNPFESEGDVRRTIDLIKKIEAPFDLVTHTLFVGRTTVLRRMYEQKKEEVKPAGKSVDTVVEDRMGESNYHDTEKFYDALKDNDTFVINSIIEFMAGRHDEQMVGRIPRYVKDLLVFDAFRTTADKYPKFKDVILSLVDETDQAALSIDLLTKKEVLEYLSTNKDVFKNLFFFMSSEHPIIYTNQIKQTTT